MKIVFLILFTASCSAITQPTPDAVAVCRNDYTHGSFTVQYSRAGKIYWTPVLANDFMKPYHWKDTSDRVWTSEGATVCFSVLDSVLHHTVTDQVIEIDFESANPFHP